MGEMDGTGRCLPKVVVEENRGLCPRLVVAVRGHWWGYQLWRRRRTLDRLHDAIASARLRDDYAGSNEGDVDV